MYWFIFVSEVFKRIAGNLHLYGYEAGVLWALFFSPPLHGPGAEFGKIFRAFFVRRLKRYQRLFF